MEKVMQLLSWMEPDDYIIGGVLVAYVVSVGVYLTYWGA